MKTKTPLKGLLAAAVTAAAISTPAQAWNLGDTAENWLFNWGEDHASTWFTDKFYLPGTEELAIDVNNIGDVLDAKGDREGASEKFSEAFSIFVTTEGPRSLNTPGAARSLLTLDVDPIAMARNLAGDPAANDLRDALEEQRTA